LIRQGKSGNREHTRNDRALAWKSVQDNYLFVAIETPRFVFIVIYLNRYLFVGNECSAVEHCGRSYDTGFDRSIYRAEFALLQGREQEELVELPVPKSVVDF
jgi:hypothetical protein